MYINMKNNISYIKIIQNNENFNMHILCLHLSIGWIGIYKRSLFLDVLPSASIFVSSFSGTVGAIILNFEVDKLSRLSHANVKGGVDIAPTHL